MISSRMRIIVGVIVIALLLSSAWWVAGVIIAETAQSSQWIGARTEDRVTHIGTPPGLPMRSLDGSLTPTPSANSTERSSSDAAVTPAPDSAPGAPTAAATIDALPSDRLVFGISISEPAGDQESLAELEAQLTAPPAIVHWFVDWAKPWNADFNDIHQRSADLVLSDGAVPMITWEPWDYEQGIDQPSFRMATIAAGDHDAHIDRWAEQIADWGRPIYMRFAQEPDGEWFPWGEMVNGNQPGDYNAAWQHVVTRFRDAGAENVFFVWNGTASGYERFDAVYPGDAWVDYVGIDIHNWGISQSWSGWVELADAMAAGYEVMQRLSNRPMILGEVCSVEQGGDKADWIRRAFLMDLPQQFPLVIAAVWYDEDESWRNADWRIASSPQSLEAVQKILTAMTTK